MDVLVNAGIHDDYCIQTLVPWTIFYLGDNSLSLGSFYQHLGSDHKYLFEERYLENGWVERWEDSDEQLLANLLVCVLFSLASRSIGIY